MNKKGRECDKQRASTATYDSMEIRHTETYKIGHRWDTTEENQHREYMETNTEQASDKDKCNTIQNRKTKNTAGSGNGRIQPPEHEQKDRTIRENRGRNRMERNPENRNEVALERFGERYIDLNKSKQKDKEYGRKQKWKDSVSETRTKR